MMSITEHFIENIVSRQQRYNATVLIIVMSIIAVVAFVICTCKLILKKKKTYWFTILLALYFSLGVLHFLPRAYYQSAYYQEVSIAPELVCSISKMPNEDGSILCYYRIKQWPFTMLSHEYSSIAQNESLQNSYTFDLDTYTYIISWGTEIQSIRYDFSKAHNHLLFPWNGLVAEAFFAYGKEYPDSILVYRIPRVAIDVLA